MYIYVDMSETKQLGNAAVLQSARFPPPPKYHSNAASPYFNSCQVSFFFLKLLLLLGLFFFKCTLFPSFLFFLLADSLIGLWRFASFTIYTDLISVTWWCALSRRIHATVAITNQLTYGENRETLAICGIVQSSLFHQSKTGTVFCIILFYF